MQILEYPWVLVYTGVLGPIPQGPKRPLYFISTPPREKEPEILLLLFLSLLLLVQLLNSFQPWKFLVLANVFLPMKIIPST